MIATCHCGQPIYRIDDWTRARIVYQHGENQEAVLPFTQLTYPEDELTTLAAVIRWIDRIHEFEQDPTP